MRDSCVLCHDPHAGEVEGFLPREGNALCLGCHDVGQHQHSLDVWSGVEKYPDAEGFPAEGDMFACRGCHRVHGSSARSLVHNRGELCIACHHI